MVSAQRAGSRSHVHDHEVQFAGRSIGIDPQDIAEGAATLFARPFNMTILPASAEADLKGVVKRIHGIGAARRVEIALDSEPAATVVEVDALHDQQWLVGQIVGLRPEKYRLFQALA